MSSRYDKWDLLERNVNNKRSALKIAYAVHKVEKKQEYNKEKYVSIKIF